jgi:phosphopantetheinyl transferase
VQTLAPEELALVEGLHGAALHERVVRLWCAKEAASKCLGIGLQGDPRAYRVVSADDACDRVTVHHECGGVETQIVRREHSIIALATEELSEIEVHR